MIPELRECDRYYYDETAAMKPEILARKYLRHYEGRFAGTLFTFLSWQSLVTRALFGWKRKSDGLRRFRELYLLGGKGTGKTPYFAAIGMHMLIGDDEAGAHIMSGATDFQQANQTMDAAKKYIKADKTLRALLDPKQHEIRYPRKNGKWTVLSGTPEGRHGFRPSCLLLDEAHEWPNGKLYSTLTANTTKRSQPLTLVATNAGESQATFAYQLHERAVAALKSGCKSGTLLPVIFEAPIELDWKSEEAARAANPSMPDVITFDQISTELEKATKTPEAQAKYRRLFLSQWQGTAAGRWLRMEDWDACLTDDQAPDDAPLYVGLDLSQVDDLSAAAFLRPTPNDLFINARFWVPKVTADRYEEEDGIPYSEWATAGSDITLTKRPTIDSGVRQEIAAELLAIHAKKKIEAVLYDPYRADETVAILEAAGVVCSSITQGFRTSPGCGELERRLKSRTAKIAKNGALRFCAENAAVQRNSYGEIRVVKPEERHQLAFKVDGISATVSALVHARKHAFPAVRNRWKGKACSVSTK